MKDFLGKDLAIGDQVVTTPKNYRGLVKATVVAFTPQQVRVVYILNPNYPNRSTQFLTPPSTLVKIV